ncbi:hypothetical protein QYM36_016772, partial [Artemia franciscana]
MLTLVLYILIIGSVVIAKENYTDDTLCTRQEPYAVNVKVSYLQPYQVRTYTACFAVPPWCSKYTVAHKVAYKTETIEKVRVVRDCCPGYARTPDNSTCVPICAQQCIHGTCVGPDKCECEPGYGGPYCTVACPDGKWGPGCRDECPCMNNARCDPLSGACTCSRGWTGERCEYPCPLGTYGLKCKQTCQCQQNSRCDPVSGECVCPDGWSGP